MNSTVQRLAALCVMVGILLVGGCARNAKNVGQVVVPNVVGVSDVDAWVAIESAGLKWDWADPADGKHPLARGEVPTVTRQTPPADTHVERGSTVLLNFSVSSGAPSAGSPLTPSTIAPPVMRLKDEIKAAFSQTYGWPNEPTWSAITEFSDADAPRVTVVTSLANKAENKTEAQGICNATISLKDQVVSKFTGAYVTAGAGGPFLATCNTY